jgi:hypothetical protein
VKQQDAKMAAAAKKIARHHFRTWVVNVRLYLLETFAGNEKLVRWRRTNFIYTG